MTSLIKPKWGPKKRGTWIHTAGICGALIFVSGCYANTIRSSRPGDGKIRTRELNFFLGGTVGHEKIDLDEICPQGFSQIRDVTTALDGFLTVITATLYAPRTAEIECAIDASTEQIQKHNANTTPGYASKTPRVFSPPSPSATAAKRVDKEVAHAK